MLHVWIFLAEIIVEESTTLNFTSSGNGYQLWNLRVPDNQIMSVEFYLTDKLSPWDNFTNLRLNDKMDNMSDILVDTCSAWVHLINRDGTFKPIYRSFTSRTSLMTLIFSSMTAQYRLSVVIGSTQHEGKWLNTYNGSINNTCTEEKKKKHNLSA